MTLGDSAVLPATSTGTGSPGCGALSISASNRRPVDGCQRSTGFPVPLHATLYGNRPFMQHHRLVGRGMRVEVEGIVGGVKALLVVLENGGVN